MAPANTDPIPTPLEKGASLIAIASALLAASLVGLLFESTRWIGIACMAALLLLYPLAFLVFVLVGGGALYFIYFR